MSRTALALALAALGLAILACGCVDATVEDEISRESNETGELSLEWALLSGDSPASCTEAGATEVEVFVLTDSANLRERMSCYGSFATVGPLPTGYAAVTLVLLDPAGEPLVSVDFDPIEIVAGRTAPLGLVEIQID